MIVRVLGLLLGQRLVMKLEIVLIFLAQEFFQYKGSVQIWETRGLGDNLILLAESLDDTEIKNLFSEHGVSVLRTDGPTTSPYLNDSNWIREHLLTLTMLRARAKIGSPETIETVEVRESIGGAISKDKFETDITITNGG